MERRNGHLTIQLLTKDKHFAERIKTLAFSCQQRGGIPCHVYQNEKLDPLPDLFLVDLDTFSAEAVKQLFRLRQQEGMSVRVVVSCQNPAPERFLEVMQAGATGTLPYHPSEAEFHALLLKISNERIPATNRRQGKLITLFGNSGGVGTTTLAINIADSLASHLKGNRNVILMDMALQRGDVSAFLDLTTSYTVLQLISDLDRLDAAYLRRVLPKHRAGFYVLPAPYAPEDADLISSMQVSRMLQLLRNFFDFVVVDAGHQFTDPILTTLEASNRILMLSLPILPSIRNARRSLDLFERLHYDLSKTLLVVNRHDALGKLDSSLIEEVLGRQVCSSIPNDYEATVQAINQGTTVRMLQPQGKLVHHLDRLVTAYLLNYGGPAAATSANSHSSHAQKSAKTPWLRRLIHGVA